jgi:hypothetical protein
MKKAQMEIMGLAIIVILVALAMLFVVQFIVLRQPSEIKKTFTHKEMAANTVNTLLSTTTNCRQLSISQLVQDCAEGGYLICPDDPNNPNSNSCTYSRDIIQQILAATLDEWNKDYYLTINVKNENVLNPFGQQCPGEKISSSPCCILPTGAGPMVINLDICD